MTLSMRSQKAPAGRRAVFVARMIVPVALGAMLGLASSASGETRTGAVRPAIGPADVPIPSELELLMEDIRDFGGLAAFGRAQVPFSEARIFFEENATDGDLGIHFAIDGQDWTRVLILDPTFRTFVDCRARGRARDNGITGLFSESAEPSFDEVPREEFLGWFPAGSYIMLGTTTDGDLLFAVATLTHDIPAEPQAVWPEEHAEVDPDEPLVIEWEPVADPNPPSSVIEAYQVIVTLEEVGERERVYQIDMPADATSVTVPAEFLEPGKDYKYEVLAVETSDNQTLTEVAFSTEE